MVRRWLRGSLAPTLILSLAACASFDSEEMRALRSYSGSPSLATAGVMADAPASSAARRMAPFDEDEVDPSFEEGTSDAAQAADNGTDPRDFAPKFMPYYRYTELENDVKENNLTVFGLLAFNKNFAATYEMPLALEREVDAGDNVGPPLNPNPLPSDGKDTGIGDLNMRFMFKDERLSLGEVLFMPVCELWFPTASEDFLGSGQFQLAPGFAVVTDLGFWPYSFAALMNFWQFDVFGDDNRDDVSFYKGRWFFMFPFPTGTYLMPEMQPIYDFEEDVFSFWVGPEVGQMLGPGRIIYAKPGWGIDNNQEYDRDFTFEFGWRWFF